MAVNPINQRAHTSLAALRRETWKLSLLPFMLLILLPLAALLLGIDSATLAQSLAQPYVGQAIRLSLATSLTTVLLTLIIGTPVAAALAQRGSQHHLLDTLVDLPTVLPPAVAGIALLMAFGRRGLVGEWLTPLGISLPFTPAAVVLAQLFVSAPLYIKSAALGFGAVDMALQNAAALDGASRWQTFRFVVLPISWVSLLSGGVLTWARAIGEFGATIIFAGNFPGRTQTMPLAIYLGFELDLRVALVLSTILITASFIAILVVKVLLHYTISGPSPTHSDIERY